MKMFSGMLAASVLCVSLVGCNNPHRGDLNAPAIKAVADHTTIRTGDSTTVSATTMNMVGVSNLKWLVSPTTATITPDKNSNGLTAIFSANEPGTYIVTATAQKADGSWVSSDVHITVNGMPINK